MQQDKEKRYNSDEIKKKRFEDFKEFCKWYGITAMLRSEDDDDYGNDDADCNLLNCC